MTIPSFRRRSAPKLGAHDGQRDRKRETWRGSRHERGYDAEWERLAARYKASVKGQCEECRRRGYLELGEAVDHIVPVKDAPDLRLEWSNLQFLCRIHHHGWKAKLEAYARKTGALRLLPQWCRHPETRPAAFAIVKRGAQAELFDAEDEARRAAGYRRNRPFPAAAEGDPRP